MSKSPVSIWNFAEICSHKYISNQFNLYIIFFYKTERVCLPYHCQKENIKKGKKMNYLQSYLDVNNVYQIPNMPKAEQFINDAILDMNW